MQTATNYAELSELARSIYRARGLQAADADDLAQQVAIRLWRQDCRTGLWEDATALVWRIALQVLSDHCRRTARRREHQSEAIEHAATVDRSTVDVDTLLPHAGTYRPAVERWLRGDALDSTDRKRVSRGIASIREHCDAAC